MQRSTRTAVCPTTHNGGVPRRTIVFTPVADAIRPGKTTVTCNRVQQSSDPLPPFTSRHALPPSQCQQSSDPLPPFTSRHALPPSQCQQFIQHVEMVDHTGARWTQAIVADSLCHWSEVNYPNMVYSQGQIPCPCSTSRGIFHALVLHPGAYFMPMLYIQGQIPCPCSTSRGKFPAPALHPRANSLPQLYIQGQIPCSCFTSGGKFPAPAPHPGINYPVHVLK